MSELLYPNYRNYVGTRVTVNNAMMALLAGSRLASHTLRLTEGSQRTLSEVFPAVEHIERFNLRSDSARTLLRDADEHLASVAIPYALATHETFVMGSIQLLREDGASIVDGGRRHKAWNMHEVLFDSASVNQPSTWLEIFHLLREMRNCLIHTGGRVQAALVNQLNRTSPTTVEEWRKLTGQEPQDMIQGDRIAFISEHVFTAFAVTKRLGREINQALVHAVSAETWTTIAVDDYAASSSKIRNSSGWRRGLTGFIRQNYGAAALPEQLLEAKARERGHWTLARWE